MSEVDIFEAVPHGLVAHPVTHENGGPGGRRMPDGALVRIALPQAPSGGRGLLAPGAFRFQSNLALPSANHQWSEVGIFGAAIHGPVAQPCASKWMVGCCKQAG